MIDFSRLRTFLGATWPNISKNLGFNNGCTSNLSGYASVKEFEWQRIWARFVKNIRNGSRQKSHENTGVDHFTSERISSHLHGLAVSSRSIFGPKGWFIILLGYAIIYLLCFNGRKTKTGWGKWPDKNTDSNTTPYYNKLTLSQRFLLQFCNNLLKARYILHMNRIWSIILLIDSQAFGILSTYSTWAAFSS